MTIARILNAKGREVITTQPERTLGEVAEVLVAKKGMFATFCKRGGYWLAVLKEPAWKYLFVLAFVVAPWLSWARDEFLDAERGGN
jgi:hypothetical protein